MTGSTSVEGTAYPSENPELNLWLPQSFKRSNTIKKSIVQRVIVRPFPRLDREFDSSWSPDSKKCMVARNLVHFQVHKKSLIKLLHMFIDNCDFNQIDY
jgi:hypothetical protein